MYEDDNSYTPLYTEYKIGDQEGGGYNELLTTFTYNPANNDFYISRRHYIEFWRIDKSSDPQVYKYDSIFMEQYDNGKMTVVNQGSKNLLLTFPYRLYYDTLSTTVHSIYQIDLSNPSSYFAEPSPNKRIADAVLLPQQDDLMLCYANDPAEHQVNTTTDHDVSVLHYSNGWFRYQSSLFTNKQGETDINVVQNPDRPLKLLKKNDGNILVSKKNEIAEISFDGTSYTSSILYYAKDNFFNKGILFSSTPIILNAVKGVEYFSALGHGSKKTSFPVFYTEDNPVARKTYLFNRLTTDQTGFFIYDPISGQTESYIQVDYPIGDVKYNPAQNQILVSQFKKSTGNGAEILVFDGTSGAYVKTIAISGYGYASRMFVSPNGKVFISVNMRYDNDPPKVVVLDASDYDITLATINSGLGHSASGDSSYAVCQAHFCYNRLNSKTYGTISHSYSNWYFMNPYHNSYNSPSWAGKDPTDRSPIEASNMPPGKFYCVDLNNTVRFFDDIEMPSELICADREDMADASYNGMVFINCLSGLLGEKLYLFDCGSEVITRKVSFSDQLLDIEYSPATNSVYAYVHEYDNVPSPNRNIIHVYRVGVGGTRPRYGKSPASPRASFITPMT